MEIQPWWITPPISCIGYTEQLGLDVKAQLKKRERGCEVDVCGERVDVG